MLLNDKTYSKVARDLFSFPVLYRSILTVYRDIFLPFYFSCAVGGRPPVSPSPRGSSCPGDPAKRRRDDTFIFICGNTVFLCGICSVLDTGCWGGGVC